MEHVEKTIAAGNRHLLLKFSKVAFLNSTAIAALIYFWKQVGHAGGSLYIAAESGLKEKIETINLHRKAEKN